MTERDDDGLCSHCGAPLYPSERCDCWDRVPVREIAPCLTTLAEIERLAV